MLLRICLICSMVLVGTLLTVPSAASQFRRMSREAASQTQPKTRPTPPSSPKPTHEQSPEPAPEASPEPSPVEEQQEIDTLKINTNLVTVPIIATNRDGNYIPDLRQEEFSISENGEQQQVAFFATVNAPFQVVLLLDTSASAEDKLSLILRAAVAFVEQLQTADRVKVISFDNEVRELSEFTNDRTLLKNAIYKAVSGRNTKLYDAFDLALSSLKSIPGRKAIVLFSDGVDWHSDRASFDGSLHWLEEEGVIVYPIRFETREQTERIAREAAEDPTAELPTIGVIHKAPSGTTAPTFPSEDPDTVPTGGQRPRTGPFGLPTAAEIMRGRRQRDPDADRFPSPDRIPPASEPADPRDGRTSPRGGRGGTFPTGRSRPRADDSVSAMLDQLYLMADSYLLELATRSGGRILRADTLGSLPDAFAKIAAELRTQYAISYYPTNKARDGQYRKIKIMSSRKGVVLRARPGYRAPSGG